MATTRSRISIALILVLAFALAMSTAALGQGHQGGQGQAPSADLVGEVDQETDEGHLTGTVHVTEIDVEDGELVASGVFEGELDGEEQEGTFEDAPLGGTDQCPILDLVLGPLDLDLLGLIVTLDTVDLDIVAERGPGNLLGNLLCAVAGLLDGGGAVDSAIGALLDRINNLLG